MLAADTALPVGTEQSDQPRHGMAMNDLLWHSLQAQDPITAQRAVCEAISRLLENDQPNVSQLEALLALDRHAQSITRELLNRYVEGDGQLRPFERNFWISALLLSRSFFQPYENVLRQMQSAADVHWRAHAHSVVVQLFHHRHIEFLLRFIRFKKHISGQWKEVHETYKFAKSRGMATQGIAAGQTGDRNEISTTPEQQYIRLLLLELMNNGQFSPREALWADSWFNRWCKLLHLQSHEAMGGIHAGQKSFVVDLDAADGLKWPATAAAGNPLFLDPSPLMAMIDEELGALGDSDALDGALASAGRDGKVALLTKLKAIFDPNPVRIARREERTSVALEVQTIVGVSNIVQVLRDEGRTRTPGVPMHGAQPEGITISPLGAQTYSPTFDVGGGASPASISIADNPGVVPEIWQVRDRSDSGSRLRGRIDDLNRIIPGSLIAFREGEDAAWVVSVVRRFRRLMVDYVEIGVEHIGRGPRFVKLVAERSSSSSVDQSADSAHRCFAALYLPPSERQPTMPIKTLLLPERNFKVDSTVTLLSSNATYTLRLNEPIQRQFEFIWTSFTVIEKQSV
jgi:hypothetical protein